MWCKISRKESIFNLPVKQKGGIIIQCDVHGKAFLNVNEMKSTRDMKHMKLAMMLRRGEMKREPNLSSIHLTHS